MIHQYKLNGYNIVLDTCSGSIHVVDEVAYDLIAGYKTMPEEELLLKANQWEISHGGLTGRAAQQFIDYIVGTEEEKKK